MVSCGYIIVVFYRVVMQCSLFAYRLSSLIELMIFIETQLGMTNSQDTGSRSIRCVCVCVSLCMFV